MGDRCLIAKWRGFQRWAGSSQPSPSQAPSRLAGHPHTGGWVHCLYRAGFKDMATWLTSDATLALGTERGRSLRFHVLPPAHRPPSSLPASMAGEGCPLRPQLTRGTEQGRRLGHQASLGSALLCVCGPHRPRAASERWGLRLPRDRCTGGSRTGASRIMQAKRPSPHVARRRCSITGNSDNDNDDHGDCSRFRAGTGLEQPLDWI